MLRLEFVGNTFLNFYKKIKLRKLVNEKRENWKIETKFHIPFDKSIKYNLLYYTLYILCLKFLDI